MDRERLFELYEKLYFHELEVREKMLNRLQIPLALLVSVVSFYGFILNSLYFSASILHLIFYVLFAISAIIFCRSLYYFVRAFFNHTYEFIPTALATEEYRNELETHYAPYPNSEEQVKSAFVDYLYKYYSQCSSRNTDINDSRSAHIHNCNKFLVLNIAPVFLVFLVYSFGKLDEDIATRPIAVEVTSPVVLRYENRLEIEQVNAGNEIIESLPSTVQEHEHERQDEEPDPAPAASPSTETINP